MINLFNATGNSKFTEQKINQTAIYYVPIVAFCGNTVFPRMYAA